MELWIKTWRLSRSTRYWRLRERQKPHRTPAWGPFHHAGVWCATPPGSTLAQPVLVLKGAAEVLTRYLAQELGVRGIAVDAVAPGAVFGGGAMPDTPEMRDYVAGVMALGRVGLSDDVGGIVAFLCTEEARWLNGQRIEVKGGMNL